MSAPSLKSKLIAAAIKYLETRAMRLASLHPGVSVEEVVENTGFELVIPDAVPETRAPDDEELRFNWNAGIAVDPFEPKTVYYGSQFVHRSRDRGETWEIISEDRCPKIYTHWRSTFRMWRAFSFIYQSVMALLCDLGYNRC